MQYNEAPSDKKSSGQQQIDIFRVLAISIRSIAFFALHSDCDKAKSTFTHTLVMHGSFDGLPNNDKSKSPNSHTQ
jgi:hypothetical protein